MVLNNTHPHECESSNSPVSSSSRSGHTNGANLYILIDKLGKGTHGSVSLAKHAKTGTLVAIKSLKRKDKRMDQHRALYRQSQRRSNKPSLVNNLTSSEIKIRREIALMRRVNHPHIVKLLDVLDDPLEKKVFIVMEYMGGGEIEWRTPEGKPIQSVLQSTRIVRDVMLGLRYLHLQGIVHRDIKPANLLWTTDRMTVKISDFGISLYTFATTADRPNTSAEDREFVDLMTDDFLNRLAGTPAFLAPELCFSLNPSRTTSPNSTVAASLSKSPSQQSTSTNDSRELPPKYAIDIWALGVTYYCLLFGHPPWEDDTPWSVYQKIAKEDFPVADVMGSDNLPTGGRHPTDSVKFPDGVQVLKILDGLMQKDPRKRMELPELKNNPYVTKDIVDLQRWKQETDVQAGELQITEEEERTAVTSVRWRSRVATGLGRLKSKLSKQGSAQIRPEGVTRSQSVRPLPSKQVSQSPRGGSSRTSNLRKGGSEEVPALILPSPFIHERDAGPSSPDVIDYSESPLSLAAGNPARLRSLSRTPGTPNRGTSPMLLGIPGTPNESNTGVRHRVREMKSFLKAQVFARDRHNRNPDSPPSRSPERIPRRPQDHRPRYSVDALWTSDRLGRGGTMSTGQRTLGEFDNDGRRVLSDGDDEDELDWSSDDYGETEKERVQRELVGAGGLVSPNSTGSRPMLSNSGGAWRTLSAAPPIVPMYGNGTDMPDPRSSREPEFRERACSPLRSSLPFSRRCEPQEQDADNEEDEESDSEDSNDNDDDDDSSDSDSEGDRPRRNHSVYSGSSSSESEEEEGEQAAPVELRLRKLAVTQMSGPTGSQALQTSRTGGIVDCNVD